MGQNLKEGSRYVIERNGNQGVWLYHFPVSAAFTVSVLPDEKKKEEWHIGFKHGEEAEKANFSGADTCVTYKA